MKTPVSLPGPWLLAAVLLAGARDLGAQLVQEPTIVQVPMAVAVEPQAVANEFVVTFRERSYDLEALRSAIYAKESAERVDAIVADLERQTARERAAFGEAIEALGGTVVLNYWIINASWIRVDAKKLEAVKALPNVAAVEPNWVRYPVLRDATNASNHNSDGANAMTGQNGRVVGTGMSVAMLDTGIDASMGSSGRPHRAYYRNGDPTNQTGGGIGGSRILATISIGYGTEDDNGHGTGTSSCAASAWGNDAGFAPDCGIVSIKVSANSSGGSNDAIIAQGWQTVMQNVTRYNIVAGNCSYSGSPSMTSAAQAALDSLAYNGNVAICVPSGNSGGNVNSTQAGYNALNVGSNEKNSSSISSFSGRGTQSTGKLIPDIVAIGSRIIVTRPNTESQLVQTNGTSFSSPSAAGAAVLVRHANKTIGALETKALLLNQTRWATASSSSGAGVMQVDLAVQAAIQSNVAKSKLNSSSKRSENFFFQLTQGTRHSVAVTWFRRNFSSTANDNLDLKVYDSQSQLVGQSTMSGANSYDRVAFTAATTGTYKAVVEGQTFFNAEIEFAIAGAGQPVPPKKPSLTGIQPSTVPAFGAQRVTLTGQDLEAVDAVHVGTTKVSPASTSATQVTFDPPVPSALGNAVVTVSNAAGTSNGVNLTYTGTHPPALIGSLFLISYQPYVDELYTGDGWLGLYYVSGSKQPSVINGVINLGIGNAFNELFLLHVFVADSIGRSMVNWAMPGNLTGKTFYMQAVGIDPKTMKLPFEVSNILERKVLF